MKFLEIDLVTQDRLARTDRSAGERAFNRQRRAFRDEASLTARLDRMRPQLFRFLVVDRERRKIMRHTLAQGHRDRVQQVVQIEISYDRVIDVEQEVQTLVRQAILGDLGKHAKLKFIRP